MDETYKYDVALSFAGEDRKYVEEVALFLKKKNIFSGGEAIVEPWEHNLNKVRCTNL